MDWLKRLNKFLDRHAAIFLVVCGVVVIGMFYTLRTQEQREAAEVKARIDALHATPEYQEEQRLADERWKQQWIDYNSGSILRGMIWDEIKQNRAIERAEAGASKITIVQEVNE